MKQRGMVIPTPLMMDVWIKQRRTCLWCGKHLGSDYMTREHIRPKSMGGIYEGDNAAVAHKECNSARSSNLSQELHWSCSSPHFDRIRAKLKVLRDGYFRQPVTVKDVDQIGNTGNTRMQNLKTIGDNDEVNDSYAHSTCGVAHWFDEHGNELPKDSDEYRALNESVNCALKRSLKVI